jgi:hypothetical protein
MTVDQLRKILEGVPGDTVVVVADYQDNIIDANVTAGVYEPADLPCTVFVGSPASCLYISGWLKGDEGADGYSPGIGPETRDVGS